MHLLVESVQSVANRLEAATWNPNAEEVVDPLKGLPYIRLQHPEHGLITSLTEGHRAASAYLFPKLEPHLLSLLDKPEGAWKRPQIGKLLMMLDPSSLLHGVFFVKLGPPIRAMRLLSGYIEAEGVGVAESGGVKLDHIDPAGPTSKGEGHLPFPLTEYTARRIVAYFHLDGLLLESYGLPEAANLFLLDLALYKIHRFLRLGLRLRSACILRLEKLSAVAPEGFTVPSEQELADRLPAAIAALRKDGVMGDPLQLEI